MQTKYPAFLGLTNLILVVASTTLMYLGSALITFYLLESLDFISLWFPVVPRVMIGLGATTFVVALYGCYVAASSSR